MSLVLLFFFCLNNVNIVVMCVCVCNFIQPLGQHQDFPYDKVTYGVKTSVSMATIVGRQILTQEGSVKKTIELEISLEVS